MGAILLAFLFAASPAAPAPAPQARLPAASTSSGALGGLVLPTIEVPAPGKVAVSVAGDFWNGSNFLLPDARTQRFHVDGGASFAPQPWIEIFGALSFTSATLRSEAGARRLGSYGDVGVGAKLVLPGMRSFRPGLLLEVDVPAGVGGFSLKGTGGRAAALFGFRRDVGPVPLAVSAVAGYRVDNTGRLLARMPQTFPAFALDVSAYDRLEGGLAVALPLGFGAPSVELLVEAPVARQAPLPRDARSMRAKLLFGIAGLRLPFPGAALSLGLQLSLASAGRAGNPVMTGMAPDSPWAVVGAVGWTFTPPKLPQFRGPRWSTPQGSAAVAPRPATDARPAVVARAPARVKLIVKVIDGKRHEPVPGSWVSIVERTDLNSTAGEDGVVRFEVEPGRLTVAVVRDGYDLLTESVVVPPGDDRTVTMELTPVPADSTLRGKLVAEDGAPVRSMVIFTLASTSAVPLPGAGGVEPRVYEGEYVAELPHGRYLVSTYTPGYRGVPLEVEVRPGETVTRDLVLKRAPGESTARPGSTGIEVSRPLRFVQGQALLAPESIPVVAEIAALLRIEGRPMLVEAWVEPKDLGELSGDEARAYMLSEERAKSAVDALRAYGAADAILTPKGRGLAPKGQPLLELKIQPLQKLPGS